MLTDLARADRLVTIFGGSGFIGRHIVRSLANQGWRVRVGTRRPDRAYYLQPLGRVGQVQAVQANLRYPDSLAAALHGSDAVVNLVGLLAERGHQTFEAVHVGGAEAIGKAAAAAGIDNVVHLSAIGADLQSKSAYGRTKAKGEAAIRAIVPTTVILRPSIVFGPEDQFFNRFGHMARFLPFMPLVGAQTKFQPVFVGDVAKAVAVSLDKHAKAGGLYELGGPEIERFQALVAWTCRQVERRRKIVPMGPEAGRAMAQFTELVSKLSLGLYPAFLTTTPDQVDMLAHDNLVSEAAVAEQRTFQGLGITPESYQTIAPTYLWRYRRTGQFDQSQRLV